jgi:diguanylate cyclase
MFFGRRKKDISSSARGSEVSQSNLAVYKLKDIISTLLDAIRLFTENNEELNTDEFKVQLDQNLARLRKTSDVQELAEIEETLKTLIFRQREAEKNYRQNQHTEYSKIIATLVEGINNLTSDNDDFNNRLDVSLSLIGRVVELDDLKQIRQQITQRVLKAKQTVQEKIQHDSENHKALSQKVEDLETRLNKAQEEVVTDSLTQVFNRRAFDERIQNEVERSKLLDQGFGLVMFDIDRFKNINDRHGHQVGDRLLAAIAKQAKIVFRVDDFVARYGGEEFAVIIHGPSINSAQNAAERLRDAIARTGFRYEKDGKVEILQITISGGVAWCRSGDTVESLIRRADQCLYLAKRTGRDRICVESEL